MISIFSAAIATIHPSIILFLFKSGPRGRTGAYSKLIKRLGYPLGQVAPLSQRDQTITLAHNYSSFIVSLELLLNLTCMSLDCGREPQYPETIHTGTGRTSKLPTERPQPAGASNANSYTAMLPTFATKCLICCIKVGKLWDCLEISNIDNVSHSSVFLSL